MEKEELTAQQQHDAAVAKDRDASANEKSAPDTGLPPELKAFITGTFKRIDERMEKKHKREVLLSTIGHLINILMQVLLIVYALVHFYLDQPYIAAIFVILFVLSEIGAALNRANRMMEIIHKNTLFGKL